MTTETPIYDRYSQEVERLKNASPEQINLAWCWTTQHSPLFDTCEKSRTFGCCITQIKAINNNSYYSAVPQQIVADIRADVRLPRGPDGINSAHYEVFADYQRRIDRELNRTPPPMLAVEPTPNP